MGQITQNTRPAREFRATYQVGCARDHVREFWVYSDVFGHRLNVFNNNTKCLCLISIPEPARTRHFPQRLLGSFHQCDRGRKAVRGRLQPCSSSDRARYDC